MKRSRKKHLTAPTVERIKPPKSGQEEHFDLGYAGLALRVSHGGVKSFVVLYRFDGKPRRLTVGRYPEVTLATAREAWRRTREAVASGIDPAIKRGARAYEPSMNFEHVVREWLQRDQADTRSLPQVESAVERYVLPFWGDRRVDEIGKRDVIELIDKIVDKGYATMARRVHAYLHRFFKWAKGRDIVTVNPLADLERRGKEASRNRVLTDGELAGIWRGADAVPVYGDAVKLLILTGARREEISALKWSEIEDGDTIKLSGDRTKTGEPHDVYLSSVTRSLVSQLPHVGNSGHVFTTNGRGHITGWSNAKAKLDEASGVTGWTVHDLRRTLATGLQKLGVNSQTIEAILGHVGGSRSGIVGVYQRHSFEPEARAALEAWGAHVMALVEGQKPGKVLPFGGKR